MSYTIPALLDIDNYLKYSTDTNPTTNDDMQNYMGNQNATLKNLVGGGGLWQPNTEYEVGTVVRSPNQVVNTLALVTVAGTTGSTEPSWSAADTSVVDGSVTYEIRKHVLSSSDIMADILLAAHPVGSYYWSKSSTSPATLFGGTWEQVKDKFVYAAGTKGVNATGGAETVTLTEAQMPRHNHSITIETIAGHTHSISMGASGAHGHNIYANNITGSWAHYSSSVVIGSSAYSYDDEASTYYVTPDIRAVANVIKNVDNHTHNIGMDTAGGHSHGATVGYNGSSQAHENMPPYIVAYCWCRTA